MQRPQLRIERELTNTFKCFKMPLLQNQCIYVPEQIKKKTLPWHLEQNTKRTLYPGHKTNTPVVSRIPFQTFPNQTNCGSIHFQSSKCTKLSYLTLRPMHVSFVPDNDVMLNQSLLLRLTACHQCNYTRMHWLRAREYLRNVRLYWSANKRCTFSVQA